MKRGEDEPTEATDVAEAEAEESADDAAAESTVPPRGPSMFGLKPLDPVERRVSLWIAAIAAAVSIGSWAPEFPNGTSVLFAAIGVVMSAALAWSARRNSRFLTGSAAFLLSFGPWRFEFAGLPFLILGLWLWFRGRPSPEEIVERRRLRDEANAARRAAKRGQPAPGPSSTGRTPPKPSKRYTPPARKR